MQIVHTEIPMQRPLANAVVSFWSYRVPIQSELSLPLSYRVLPDGCVDLIVRYTHPQRVGEPGLCALLVSGALSRFKVVELTPHTTLWGMQFRPGWVEAVLGVPPLALLPRPQPVQHTTNRCTELVQRLRAAATPQQVEITFHDGVSQLVAAAEQRRALGLPPAEVSAALQLLDASTGQLRMRQLALLIGISERTLHRQLSRSLGLSPKLFARITRFQHVVARLRECNGPQRLDLAALALESGYTDQAHMTHEFRNLSGLTPRSFAD
ncbi:MAG: AraC family transcriptional regulator [Roseiflexaceae bacterium]|nr:AraC family transcriptional regulator [Roseiflexaceae bacterium]